MKRFILTIAIACIGFYGFSQENLLSISGGYAFANVDDSEYFTDDPDVKGTGWRINGTYDFNRSEGPIAYGFSVGYISVSAEYEIAYMTNNYYRNGLMQSVMGGIGVRF